MKKPGRCEGDQKGMPQIVIRRVAGPKTGKIPPEYIGSVSLDACDQGDVDPGMQDVFQNVMQNGNTFGDSPRNRADWADDLAGTFDPDDRHADELCVTELASVIWAVQMSTVEFHPWNSRADDTEAPDEWRIDLDPMPECPFDRVRRVAAVAHEDEFD